MENKVICPETMIKVLMMAHQIPDRATVAKRTGDQTFTLRHQLKVYPYLPREGDAMKAIEIDGFFIVGSQGGINQVRPDVFLHWVTHAEDFVNVLKESWEPEPQ